MNQLPLTTHSFFTIIHLFGTYNSTVGRALGSKSYSTAQQHQAPLYITVIKYKFSQDGTNIVRWKKEEKPNRFKVGGGANFKAAIISLFRTRQNSHNLCLPHWSHCIFHKEDIRSHVTQQNRPTFLMQLEKLWFIYLPIPKCCQTELVVFAVCLSLTITEAPVWNKVFLDVDIMAQRGRRPWIFHSGSQGEVIRHSSL